MSENSNYHHGNLSAALIKTAIEHVSDRGASSLTLRQIAHSLGVTPPAVYRHFRSREELLDEVVLFGYDELNRIVLQHISEVKGKKRFVGAALGYVAFAEQYPNLFLLIFGSDGETGRGKIARDKARVSLERRIHTALYEYLGRAPSATLVLQAWAIAHGFAALVANGVISGDDRKIGSGLNKFAESLS